jgi:uncharacterized protein (TIGR02145 family)
MKRFERTVGLGRVAAVVVGVSCLIFSAAFVSCGGKNTGDSGDGNVKPQESVTNDSGKSTGGDGGGVKLLGSITDDSGKVLTKFEYDEQKRLVKIYSSDTTTIVYADNLVTVNGERFAINGNTIKGESETLTINKDRYIVKNDYVGRSADYQYKDGNLISLNTVKKDDSIKSSYEYDNKKSPFANSKTPKWLFKFLFRDDLYYAKYTSRNNVLGYDWEQHAQGEILSGIFEYEYEYDSDGFPIMETEKLSVEGNDETTITRFTYTGGGKAEPSAKTNSEADAGSFTDSRDGKKYGYVKTGAQIWMAENLNYAAEGSKCYGEYDDTKENCPKYGRLYNWKTALKVCPNGWHLSTDAEWQALVNSAGGRETAGKLLKAKSGWNDYEGSKGLKSGNGDDAFGFSALPGGSWSYVYNDDNYDYDYFGAGDFGRWWTATEKNVRWTMDYYGTDVNRDNTEYVNGGSMDNYLYSVRCVRD